MSGSSRAWEPTVAYRSSPGGHSVPVSVRRWEWSPREGLMVVFKDGARWPSAWRTLPEFLKALRDGREVPVMEVTP